MKEISRKKYDKIYQAAIANNQKIDLMVESKEVGSYQLASNILDNEELVKPSLQKPGEFFKTFYEGIKHKPIRSMLGATALIPAGILLDTAVAKYTSVQAGLETSQADAKSLAATAMVMGVAALALSAGTLSTVYEEGAKKRIAENQ